MNDKEKAALAMGALALVAFVPPLRIVVLFLIVGYAVFLAVRAMLGSGRRK